MTLEIPTHRTIFINILKDIYTNPELGSLLGFKGGTAAYLFYNLERFSVDLDFDLLDQDKETLTFEKLETILKQYGTLIEARKKRFSLIYILSYHNKTPKAYNIKVEVNLRNFGSRYEVKSYLGIPMKVMIQEDMFAHKLVTLLERPTKANRDIFDVWFFLKNHWPINEKIIEQRTGISIQQFLQKCIETIEQISNRGILTDIGELLNTKQKVWVKEKLKHETIFLLQLTLDALSKTPQNFIE
jgi:predicted nucleotidyltransferase component of viral defense system